MPRMPAEQRIGLCVDYLDAEGAGSSATGKEEVEAEVMAGARPPAAVGASSQQRRISVAASQRVFRVLAGLSIIASVGDTLPVGKAVVFGIWN